MRPTSDSQNSDCRGSVPRSSVRNSRWCSYVEFGSGHGTPRNDQDRAFALGDVRLRDKPSTPRIASVSSHAAAAAEAAGAAVVAVDIRAAAKNGQFAMESVPNISRLFRTIITGPPAHSVGASIVLLSSVCLTLHSGAT